MITYWLWLINLKGIGPVTIRKLVDRLGSPMAVYQASIEELQNIKGLKLGQIETLLSQHSLESAQRIEDYMQRNGINLLTYDDPYFPPYINEFPGLPAILYYRGKLRTLTSSIGIVGSRRCTAYGKEVTADAAAFLGHAGMTVVSGMAKGIDSYAHTACLKAGGYTLALVANGVDICYPPEHQMLMEEIVESGAVISSYPPGTRPRQEYFPERNKLLAAWVEKLLVVEAADRSGALITAEYAMWFKHRVYAVPNSIYSPESLGTNRLLLHGAEVYLGPDQLLKKCKKEDSNNSLLKKPQKSKALKKQRQNRCDSNKLQEQVILDRLDQVQDINDLLDVCNGDISGLIELLCRMELEGKVSILGQKVKRLSEVE
ncbi:DNA protecting protein DprA [Desulfosporosinus acidiphilus SJ4]|uniref:DNA protecting protein DprA n=1 Tax=Desulfosporosinus acidiphilus (strain DSM 22704 / JCM 16185 / SJ4) TaxID=646529 RepID=I4DBE2_DESAJ|nr:DNA-processing protein DprA [Desulfosporosinus acidiphilus]AFM43116.1 DNA protecting protein DprA [Desulfosporosinus acidiphilus SJ4]